jgi:hypothetical protein
MRNLNRWLFAIVFAALSLPAVSQVSNPPAAAISPFAPLAVTTEAEFAKANPGTRHHHVVRQSREMEEAAEEFNERQRERVERRNRELERRFLEIKRAGGWQKVFLGQLEHARQVLPNSQAQLDAAQQFLGNFAICQTPLVASVTSEFQETLGAPNAGPPFVIGRIDKESTIEPLAAIMLDGCAFGPDAGQIELVFNPDIGVTAPLQIKQWSDNSVLATLPRMPGLKDQEAELVITTKTGARATVPVQFFQHRIAAPFDAVGQINSLAVGTTAHTTNDDFRVISFATGGHDIIAGHYTFCCSAVSGTDRWFFKLNNGWQMAVPPTFLVRDYDDAGLFSSLFFLRFEVVDGTTECGLFSSGEGSVTDQKILGAPADFPQFQGEVDVSWQVGSNCSGIVYIAQIFIVGPEGVPYI